MPSIKTAERSCRISCTTISRMRESSATRLCRYGTIGSNPCVVQNCYETSAVVPAICIPDVGAFWSLATNLQNKSSTALHFASLHLLVDVCWGP